MGTTIRCPGIGQKGEEWCGVLTFIMMMAMLTLLSCSASWELVSGPLFHKMPTKIKVAAKVFAGKVRIRTYLTDRARTLYARILEIQH